MVELSTLEKKYLLRASVYQNHGMPLEGLDKIWREKGVDVEKLRGLLKEENSGRLPKLRTRHRATRDGP